MKDLFISFLRDEDIFKTFLSVLKHYDDLDEYLEDIISDSGGTDFVCSVCIWGETIQGHEFWMEINDKWLNKISEFNNKQNEKNN